MKDMNEDADGLSRENDPLTLAVKKSK